MLVRQQKFSIVLLPGHTTIHSCYKSPHHIATDSTILRWQGAQGRDDGSIVTMLSLTVMPFSLETRWSTQLVLSTCFISFTLPYIV